MNSPLLFAFYLVAFYAIVTVLFIDKKGDDPGRATVPVTVKR